MSWPLSQEYNEAIQSPASSFADPELRGGEAATNEIGLPMPRSGNFADVYEVHCGNGSSWAVKCFTREVPGLHDRYQEISRSLQQLKLPFTVDFTYLDQGIRIRGDWYPILKMQWVEGFTLNDFIRQQLDKPAMLGGLLQIWARMATRLHEAGIAHADLQHGNVLLVPGSTANSVAVKLIDYDGMFVPSLADKKSGEVGHPSYQHPERLRTGIYSPEVDRFPVLLIATALRALRAGGKTLWDKYDNGDNLLFREQDLAAPDKSVLFKELLKLPDPADRSLVERLIDSTRKTLDQTPRLDEVLSEARPVPVRAQSTPKGVSSASDPISNWTKANPKSQTADAASESWADDDESAANPDRGSDVRKKKGIPALFYLVGGAVLAGMVLFAGVVGVGLWAIIGGAHAQGGPDQDSITSNDDGSKRPGDQRVFAGLDDLAIRPAAPNDVAMTGKGLHPSYCDGNRAWSADGSDLVPEKNGPKGDWSLVFGDFRWTDYDFACEARISEPNASFGLIYHCSDQGFDKFFVEGSWFSGFLARSSLQQPYGQLAAKVEVGWHKARVSLRGATCRCFFDDEKVLEFVANYNSRGAVGIWAQGQTTRFRNPRVTDPTGKVLFEGMPDLPANGDQWPPVSEPASADEIQCLKGYVSPVSAVAFSRDGRRVLSCSTEFPATTRLWDVESGKELARSEVPGHTSFGQLVVAADVSRFLVSTLLVSRNSRVFMGQLEGDQVSTPVAFPEEAQNVVHLCFSADASKARALCRNGTIFEWNLADKGPGRQLNNKIDAWSGVLAPNGRFALLSPRNKSFEEIDLDSGKPTARWKDDAGFPAESMAISADSSRVLAGRSSLVGNGVRDVVEVWDVASAKQLATLDGHKDRVIAVAFSRDGRYALSGSRDHTVRLWDLAGQKELACFKGHTGSVTSVAFSPDGTRAVSGSEDHTIRLWNLGIKAPSLAAKSAEPVGKSTEAAEKSIAATVSAPQKNIRQSYSPQAGGQWTTKDGELFYALGGGGEWPLVFGDFSWKDYDFTFELNAVNAAPFHVLFHVTGTGWDWIDFGTFGKTSQLARWMDFGTSSSYASREGKLEQSGWHKYRVSVRGANCKCFFDDEKLFDYKADHNPRGAVGFALRGNTVHVRNIRVTDPTGKVLFEGMPELPAKSDQWPPPSVPDSPNELHCLKGHCAPVNAVAFSVDGRRVLTCDHGEPITARLWDVDTGKELAHSDDHSNMPTLPGAFGRLATAPNDARFLSSTFWGVVKDPRVFLGQFEGDKLSTPIAFPEDAPDALDLCFSADGRKARALCHNGIILEWNLVDKSPGRQINAKLDGVTSGAIAPNGRFALLTRENKPFEEIDLESGKPISRWKDAIGLVRSMAISADSKQFLVGMADGQVEVWDVASTKRLATLKGHQGPVLAVAISRDGKYGLSGGLDYTVRLWDLALKTELACFKGHTNAITSVAFSPDGKCAASSSADYTVRLWNLTAKPQEAPTKAPSGKEEPKVKP